ncbi:MAG: phenylalanine--tRNA ligase subunit beta [Thiobacillaceae bacterium]|jgi:phenylalanyl-tRNA synthetase beta chain
MQFSEAWLRSFVNPRQDTEQLAHVLTMAGLEVEAITPVAPVFSGVVVGQILSVEKHPDADRLRLCKVAVGESELQIVCGAPNAAAGLKVPCARVGAKLPGITIAQAKVRGVESFGMLCSAKELGLAEDSDGLMVLPADAPVGADIRTYLELDDHVITLKLTPNRADCLSMIGIAREVSAITGTTAYLPSQAPVMQDAFDTFPVMVEASQACPLYCGRVIKGINPNVETPLWMLNRLERGGIRSISAPVDITNYVMLELGQPLHAFDLSKLKGGLRVRLARAGETLTLLNGQQADLSADMLAIADENGPVALAGVMGGESTSVEEHCQNIFLESAFFRPEAIAGRARVLGLSTDSSHRFERGVDYAATRVALERATALMLSICGGKPGPMTEISGGLPIRQPIRLRLSRAQRMLGIDLTQADAEAMLVRLGCQIRRGGEDLLVTPPSFRFDLSIEADLVEELARLTGYDLIPAAQPQARLALLPADEKHVDDEKLKLHFVGRDYQEVITYSFVDPTWEQALDPHGTAIALTNPIASQMSVMRTSLWGGLIEVLKYNLNRQLGRVRVIEQGRVYHKDPDGLRQTRMLGGLAYGDAAPEQWGRIGRMVDFFDVKSDLESLPGESMAFVPGSHPALHPGQCAQVLKSRRPIGWLGTLHPRLVQHFELPLAPVMFELELDAVSMLALPQHGRIARFPAVRRDLAFVVGEAVTVREMLAAMQEVADPIVQDIALFDVYLGKGLGEKQKSLAFRVVMQDTERTLTDGEVEMAVAAITQKVIQEFNATLRA